MKKNEVQGLGPWRGIHLGPLRVQGSALAFLPLPR